MIKSSSIKEPYYNEISKILQSRNPNTYIDSVGPEFCDKLL